MTPMSKALPVNRPEPFAGLQLTHVSPQFASVTSGPAPANVVRLVPGITPLPVRPEFDVMRKAA